MNLKKVMDELKKMGEVSNAELYKKQGSGENVYGVSFSNLEILSKKIKTNHELALALWEIGNIDARFLATMVAEPEEFGRNDLDAWLEDIDYYLLVDIYAANVAAKTRFAQHKMEKWIDSDREWTSRAGWQLLAHLAMGEYGLPNIYFTPFLKLIPSQIHRAPNRVRDAMNNALIAIGLRNDILEKRALNAAGKMGDIEISRGEGMFKTPNATEYIKRVKRGRKRAGLE